MPVRRKLNPLLVVRPADATRANMQDIRYGQGRDMPRRTQRQRRITDWLQPGEETALCCKAGFYPRNWDERGKFMPRHGPRCACPAQPQKHLNKTGTRGTCLVHAPRLVLRRLAKEIFQIQKNFSPGAAWELLSASTERNTWIESGDRLATRWGAIAL